MEPIRGPFLLLFLTVTAVLILGCQASDSGNRDTSKPSPAKVLQATKGNPTPTRTLQPTDLPSTTAVQYCSDGDRRNAVTVSKAFDWPLIHVCSDAELSTYANWVLVGGQYANPIYKLVLEMVYRSLTKDTYLSNVTVATSPAEKTALCGG